MNNIYEERKEKIGNRISEERKKIKEPNGRICTQERLADKLNEISGTESVSQGTISQWERGKIIPPLDRLLALSKVFGCDCAYLLCDYDDKTHDSSSISDSTGLSEDSVNFLSAQKQWGICSEARMIDFLLLDAKRRPVKHNYRSILDLLSFFFKYRNNTTAQKQVFVNGSIVDADRDGFISENAMSLNERIIENAVLNEITRALISLKEKTGNGD